MPIRRLARTLASIFSSPSRQTGRRRGARPQIEPLEDRCVPATTTSTLSGFAFIDGNSNGVRDAGETRLPGVVMTFPGTPTQGSPVSTSATTDSNGPYSLFNVLPGNYLLTAGPAQAVMGVSRTAQFQIAVGPGQSIHQDVEQAIRAVAVGR